MNVKIPYGQKLKILNINKNSDFEIVSPKETIDKVNLIESFSNPLNFQDLNSFISNKKKILVIVNDHTRPTPTAEVLKHLPLKGKEITTIVATGSHRSPSNHELMSIFGDMTPPYNGVVSIHNCRDKTNLKYMGKTSWGTELYFNSKLFEVDGIIVIGSVEPHYFAGFTGGRKFLMPALAGFTSIEMNHSLALQPEARLMKLDGNPIHEDFMEALKMFNRNEEIFSIQLVTDFKHKINHLSSGNIIDSFQVAVEKAKDVYVIPIERKADIVITVNKPPMDVNLYQSQKAIESSRVALNDEGIIILVSKCRDGIGDEGFYKLLASGGDILYKIKKGYKFGYHKTAKFVELMKRSKVWAVTDLQPELLTKIGIKPYNDIQKAYNDALKIKGLEAKTLIVLDGCLTIPIPKN